MAKNNITPAAKNLSSSAMQLILDAKHHDPFNYLGLHEANKKSFTFRIFLPHALKVWLKVGPNWVPLEKQHKNGLFVWDGEEPPTTPCLLRIEHTGGTYETYDAYSFMPFITDDELHLFGEGNLNLAYNTLGARECELQGVQGVRFAVWAPSAERVSVVGNFNQWDGRVNPMRVRGASGVWEIFIPNLCEGELYKFEIRNRHTGAIFTKIDPYALEFELRPGTASRVSSSRAYPWQDTAWLNRRANND